MTMKNGPGGPLRGSHIWRSRIPTDGVPSLLAPCSTWIRLLSSTVAVDTSFLLKIRHHYLLTGVRIPKGRRLFDLKHWRTRGEAPGMCTSGPIIGCFPIFRVGTPMSPSGKSWIHHCKGTEKKTDCYSKHFFRKCVSQIYRCSETNRSIKTENGYRVHFIVFDGNFYSQLPNFSALFSQHV